MKRRVHGIPAAYRVVTCRPPSCSRASRRWLAWGTHIWRFVRVLVCPPPLVDWQIQAHDLQNPGDGLQVRRLGLQRDTEAAVRAAELPNTPGRSCSQPNCSCVACAASTALGQPSTDHAHRLKVALDLCKPAPRTNCNACPGLGGDQHTGMLVVDSVLPSGPADGHLQVLCWMRCSPT